MCELEDEWIKAIAALPDAKQLADLLGSGAPMPPSAHDLLADVWINAIAALPDAKPLANLLRCGAPISPGARDLLAEMLNPGKPDICGGKLVYKETSGLEKAMRNWLPVAEEHAKGVSEGKSSENAAFDVGESRKMSGRQVLRYKQSWRQLIDRLRGNR
jgi:hypothetical protein